MTTNDTPKHAATPRPLTDAQRRALEYAAANETVYTGRYGELDGKVVKALVKRGLMQQSYAWNSGVYTITAAGRAVLALTPAPTEPSTQDAEVRKARATAAKVINERKQRPAIISEYCARCDNYVGLDELDERHLCVSCQMELDTEPREPLPFDGGAQRYGTGQRCIVYGCTRKPEHNPDGVWVCHEHYVQGAWSPTAQPQPAPDAPTADAATFDELLAGYLKRNKEYDHALWNKGPADEKWIDAANDALYLAQFVAQHAAAIRTALVQPSALRVGDTAVVLDAQQRKVLETLTADNTRLIDTGQPHKVSIVFDVFEIGFVPTAMYFDLKDKGWIYHVPGKGYVISDAGREALRRIDSGGSAAQR